MRLHPIALLLVALLCGGCALFDPDSTQLSAGDLTGLPLVLDEFDAFHRLELDPADLSEIDRQASLKLSAELRALYLEALAAEADTDSVLPTAGE